MNLTPLEDGVTHINVYSKGKTTLGRLLTNPSDLGVELPRYGYFRTLEGFHFFLKTGASDYNYAKLSGFMARQKGKDDSKLYVPCEDFDLQMRTAWVCKITQHRELYELVLTNTLPLAHYYFYGKEDNCKIIPDKSNFITNLTEVCNFLKGQ